TGRHAAGVSGNRSGAGRLPKTDRGNQAETRAQGAGDGSAQSARVLAGGAVPILRQDPRVPQLRHRAHPSQTEALHGMPLLRIHGTSTEPVRLLWERVHILSWDRLRKTGRTAARILP